jgi:putative DeoR family transcriptional regulator (stage III sporulation protein D)
VFYLVVFGVFCHIPSIDSIRITIRNKGGYLVREDIIDRILEEANYIAQTNATVRATAKIFHFSKSTVHKDVTERLKDIDKELYLKVKRALKINLEERHIRGGLATKKKYCSLKMVK